MRDRRGIQPLPLRAPVPARPNARAAGLGNRARLRDEREFCAARGAGGV